MPAISGLLHPSCGKQNKIKQNNPAAWVKHNPQAGVSGQWTLRGRTEHVPPAL